jgi:tetratricopeptide (TPR) repeat protein
MKQAATSILASSVFVLLVAAPARSESKVDQTVKKAVELIDKGKVDEALQSIEKLQRETGAEAQLGVSKVLTRAGKLDEALAAARKSTESPSSPAELRGQALAQLAALELRVGSSRDALAHAQEARKLSTTPETQATYIRAWARTKDPAAIAEAESLVKAAPANAAAHDALGRALAADERFDEADAAFAKAITLDPKLYRARLHRAMAKVDAGKGAEAETLALELTKLDKNLPEGWVMLGAALITKDLDKWQAAIDPAQQGVFLAPHSPYAQYWVGRIFEAAKNPQESESAYKHAVEADPDFVPAQVRLIELNWSKDVEGAATVAAKIAEDHPWHPEAQFLYGRILVKKGDYAGALDPLERAARLRPKDASVSAELGEAYRGNREYARAADFYKHAIELASDNSNYQRLYGLLLAAAKKCTEAAPLLEKAARAQPAQAGEAYFTLGWCQFQVARDSNNKDMVLQAKETALKAKAKLPPDDMKGIRLINVIDDFLSNRRRLAGTPPPPPVKEAPCDLAALYKEASGGSEGTRVRAIRKMVCAGDDAVKYLVSYLGDSSLPIKTAGAKALTGVGAPAREACPQLTSQMTDVQKASFLGPANKRMSSGDEAKLMRLQGDFVDAAREAKAKIGCK